MTRFFVALMLAWFFACKPAASSKVRSESSDEERYYLSDWVREFEKAWPGRTIKLQSALDNEAPFGRSTFLGTHNSYNSHAYEALFRYIDPNQVLSIYEQLHIGVRAVELDVHSTFSNRGWPWEWGNKLVLCHAKANHVGCSGFDRHFEDALLEVKAWLEKSSNSPEVLMIYLEDFIEGDLHDDAIDIIYKTIGSYVYQPRGGQCEGVPLNLTKRQVLESGKRVLLMTDGCTHPNFQSWVFGGVGERRDGLPTDDQKTYLRYPTCRSQRFDDETFDRSLIRFFEDRTFLTNNFGEPEMEIDDGMSRELFKCGANLMGWDMLVPDDGRVQQGIWSWDPMEPTPANGEQRCAQHVESSRLKSIACHNTFRFACREKNGDAWFVTDASGPWNQGHSLCQSESSGKFEFAAPYSERDSMLLNDMKARKNAGNPGIVWINHFDSGNNVWKVQHK